jgi:hypothetical protein
MEDEVIDAIRSLGFAQMAEVNAQVRGSAQAIADCQRRRREAQREALRLISVSVEPADPADWADRQTDCYEGDE